MGHFSHDVLIVGGGGAGLRGAIAIAEETPNLSIAVVSKVIPMRSHTVAAEGGAATISGGDWLCDQDAVEAFVGEAVEELLQLEHWGCPWSRLEDGSIAVRPFGGMKLERTWYAADKTGFHILHTLFQTSLKYKPIQRYDEWFVTDLLVEDGRCQGVIALELATGRVRAIFAKSVVICTGGCGKVFSFTTNANIKNGDGMALAYRAGVPLKDMEFIQYHPTGLPFTGILITEATRSEGGVLLNKDGYRYLQDYDLGTPQPKPVLRSMELGPRDRLSQAFVKEQEKGRTIKGPYGDIVHLDIRHLGKDVINSKLPFVRELCLKYQNIDPIKEMIPVRPVVHYMMGGIHTDINGATPLDGLYAAGEVACVSINGANRLGSNSLTEILVFGKRACSAAAQFALEQKEPDSTLELLVKDKVSQVRGQYFNNNGGTETIAGLREEMQNVMEESAGIYRSEDSLKGAISAISELKDRFQNINVSDRSYTFNTEIISAMELSYMLDVAEAIVHSAIARTESRGSHQRIDYPDRDDERFLAHSLAYKEDKGSPRVEYLPVVITRWPPAERVYGK